MSLSAAEIGRVVETLHVELRGAVVREVLSPDAGHRLVLELRAVGANHFLQIVLQNGATRIGRVAARPAGAPSPHPFVMLLRRDLAGLAVESVEQVGGDRVVRLELASEGRRAALVAELTSRHANVFFVCADGRIGGSFHPNRSGRRALNPGRPYVAPLPHPLAEGHKDRFAPGPDLEARIEGHYAGWEAEATLEALRAHARGLLAAARRRLVRLRDAIAEDERRAALAERLFLLGHLLKANLGAATRGRSSLAVVGFDGAEEVIPLDPRLDAAANMERLFSKAKRLKAAAPRIAARRTDVEESLRGIDLLEEAVARAAPEELASLVEDMARRFPRTAARRPPPGRPAPDRLPYREVAIAAGRPARIGRSAADNDTLTLRHAKPDDLWLHVRGRAGSHVVVPMGRGEDPTPDMLVDAAHLAAHFSSARGDGDVEVCYTRRRYVQKPRGAPPGAVRLLKEKTILVRIEGERLARLLRASGGG